MRHKVIFRNWNCNMAGCLFLPDDFDEKKKYAALTIVIPEEELKNRHQHSMPKVWLKPALWY